MNTTKPELVVKAVQELRGWCAEVREDGKVIAACSHGHRDPALASVCGGKMARAEIIRRQRASGAEGIS